MTVSSSIITDLEEIRTALRLTDSNELPYIVNRVSDVCLTKFVELIFRNKFGDPLRLQPFQSVMLHMMWHKKFPLVLACRGAGKCVREALTYSRDGMLYLEEMLDHNKEGDPQFKKLQMLGENGYNPTDYGWDNGESETKVITTNFGYRIEGTPNHPIRVMTPNGIEWRNLEDIKEGDRVPIYRKPCEFGIDAHISEDMGYLIGLLIGDGGLTQRNTINFTNIDEDIINEFKSITKNELNYNVKKVNNKPTYLIHNTKFYDWLMSDLVGCKPVTSHYKSIPIGIRRSTKPIVRAFLQGWFDTDGGCTSRGIEGSSASKKLIREIQSTLLAFGIVAKVRKKMVKYKNGRNEAWVLHIGGQNIDLFAQEIGFRSKTKQAKLQTLVGEARNTNIDTVPFIDDLLISLGDELKSIKAIGGAAHSYSRQLLAPSKIKKYEPSYDKLRKILDLCSDISYTQNYKSLEEIIDQNYFYDTVSSVEDDYGRCWDVHIPEDHSFVSNGFISHNTFMIAVYCLLRTLLIPGTKIVIVSGGFRQAKFTFQYMDELIKSSPILQEAIRKYHPGNAFGVKFATDKVYLNVGQNTSITGIPIGDGSKVRGMRATCLICDEVASIDEHVFDTAIGPFLSVKADPSEAVMMEEFIAKLRRMNVNPSIIKLVEDSSRMKGNQFVLTGTATYQFNHFFKRYEAYKLFAGSGGDRKVIKEGLQIQAGESKVAIDESQLDLWEELYTEYAIFQLPYYAMPKGFLDDGIIATHRATMDPVVFGHEYECSFSKDTNGFFPRSIIEAASPGLLKDGEDRKEDEVHYELYGDPHSTYVMGLDPARHNDNFGLVVLKIENRTAKCVYVDAWDKTDWVKSIRKIRDVLKRFPKVVRIAMDSGGGGDTVRDLLANVKMLKADERPIIDIEPDGEQRAIPDAIRILEMINFHTWSAQANHALRSDIILKNLLFPGRVDDGIIMHRHSRILKDDGTPFDVNSAEDVQIIEHLNDLLYGTDDEEGYPLTLGNIRETRAMVDELCTIVQTVTEKGSETFGLQKLSDQPEGLDIRRRDRYSALLLAAHAAREVMGHGLETGYGVAGGSPGMILGGRQRRNRYRPMQNKNGIIY